MRSGRFIVQVSAARTGDCVQPPVEHVVPPHRPTSPSPHKPPYRIRAASDQWCARLPLAFSTGRSLPSFLAGRTV
jgi:hypothetical protein